MDLVTLAFLVAVGHVVIPAFGAFGTPAGAAASCRLGEVRACGATLPFRRRAGLAPGGVMTCKRTASGASRFDESDCNTPLVLVFDGTPVTFTRPPGDFRIGASPRTEWIGRGARWLLLDRDGSGCAEDDRELFGAGDGFADGFEKLAVHDDDGDGRIDARDPVFARLALWSDDDQDRRCSPGEVVSLTDASVISIELSATRPRTTRFGSHEGARASFRFTGPDRRPRHGSIVDVYLAPM
jgi:hypothetical protein